MEEDLAPPLKKQKLESSLPEASLEECDGSGGSHAEAGGGKMEEEGRACQTQSNSTNNRDHHHVMERDVGITECISPQLPGFFAILKQRLNT